jgi:uncharacterized membrane protein
VVAAGGGGSSSGAFFWQAAKATLEASITAVATRMFIGFPLSDSWIGLFALRFFDHE